MPRIRTIKPGFFRSQVIADLPLSARLTFVGLWTYVDDAGRGVDDARLVKGDLWQLDEKHPVKKVEADLMLLANAGLIERYEINGKRFLRVVNWSEHQRINRPSKSTIPASLTESSQSYQWSSNDGSSTERKGNGREVEWKGDDLGPKGLEVVVAEEEARSVSPPAPAAEGGAGSQAETAETELDPVTVQRNVQAARAARQALRTPTEAA